MKKVDRWASLVALFLFLSLLVPLVGCGDDDDDDETDDDAADDDAADDDAADDDAADDDVVDDDVTDDDTTQDYLTVTPWAEMIPAGTTFAFAAEAMVDGVAIADGFTWSMLNTSVATVAEDGTVTGVVDGQTTLTATYGLLSDEAIVMVGPDVYVMDNLQGLLMGIDRGSETAIGDLLAEKGSIAVVANDLNFDPDYALLFMVDSGDYGAGVTGDEKLLLIDPLDGWNVTEVALDQDSPWMATLFADAVWVTGNLDDTLAKVDLADGKLAVSYYDLDESCVPTDVVGAGDYLYVACSGFDLDTFTYADGKVLVIDPATGAKVKQIDLPQVNPTNMAIAHTEDCNDLFVVCAGDYGDNTGKIVKICTTENVVKTSFDLGIAPTYIAINEAGTAFVGEGMAGSVYIFDAATGAVSNGTDDPIAIPGAMWVQGIGTHNDTGDAYVCDQLNGKVYVIDGDDFTLGDTPYTLTNPGAVAFW